MSNRRLSVSEAARRAEVEIGSVYRKVWSGTLDARKDPATGSWLISEKDVDRWINQRRQRMGVVAVETANQPHSEGMLAKAASGRH